MRGFKSHSPCHNASEGAKSPHSEEKLYSMGNYVSAIGFDLYNQTLTGAVSKTLNAIRSDADHVPVAIIRIEMGKQITLTEKRFFKWVEDDIAVSLRASSGSYGGGQRGSDYLLYQQTIGALCATDYKWVQQEQVMQGKLIVMAVCE